MNSRIEQIIEEIEEYIDGCKIKPLSNGSQIIVNREEIDELLTELRTKTPDEIKRYQKIIKGGGNYRPGPGADQRINQ